MNTALWITQGILATVFASSGLIILLLPKEKLAPKLSWVREYSDGTKLFICLAKITGSIGLILPMYLNILPVLTPIAALGLATIMLLALLYHLRRNEFKDIPATIIFLALTLFIVINRFQK